MNSFTEASAPPSRGWWSSLTDAQQGGVLLGGGLAAACLINGTKVPPARALYLAGMAALAILVGAGMVFSRRPVTRSSAVALLVAFSVVQLAQDWLRGAGVTLSGAGLTVCASGAAWRLWQLRGWELVSQRKATLVLALLHVSGRRGAAEDAHTAAGHPAPWAICEDPACGSERQVCADLDRDLTGALHRLFPPAPAGGDLPWLAPEGPGRAG